MVYRLLRGSETNTYVTAVTKIYGYLSTDSDNTKRRKNVCISTREEGVPPKSGDNGDGGGVFSLNPFLPYIKVLPVALH